MSSNIIASIQPAKERLVNLLLEINSIELKSPEPDATIEQQEILYTMRNRTLEDKLRRIQLCIKTLQSISDDWLKYTRTITSTKKKEEEEKAFEVITMGETGIYQILQQGNEAIITLIMHKEDVEQKLIQLSKEKRKDVEVSNLPSTPNVHLPQLSLPTFNGDPRQWRQFWSSFNAAVHSQPIPEIQKLNYLYSCLNGNALEVVLGYDIAPENYEIVRRLLREKYGDPSAATTILYKELRSIKRDEKEWVKMVEHIEKVIRQLEALGENMEHSSIEHWIEDKLPGWILDKVFEQKELDVTWSVSKLRNFLLKRVNRSEKVKNCQKPNTQADSKLTTTKFMQKQRYSPVGTSALSTIQSPQKVSQPTIKSRRPCVFCTRDHWDSECGAYSTVKARTNRLKILKECLT
uniref:Gag protein n=1 Tax=Loa loa TaxID=7209 RepID=A0A1I7V6D8_LOALO